MREQRREPQPQISVTQQGGSLNGRGDVRMVPEEEVRSYYGRPVIKEPTWKPDIAWYFFAGGLAGASSGLAFVARLESERRGVPSAVCGMLHRAPHVEADVLVRGGAGAGRVGRRLGGDGVLQRRLVVVQLPEVMAPRRDDSTREVPLAEHRVAGDAPPAESQGGA